MPTISLFGAAGRMGQAIAEALLADRDITIACAIDTEAHAGQRFHDISIQADRTDLCPPADVWVDVSTAESAFDHSLRAESAGIPILIAATGFSPDQADRLDRLSNAHILTANLSLGVNLLLDTIARMRSALGPGYDVGIVETHHIHKKDAPSGTAKGLASSLEKVGGPVQVSSLRLGEIVGEHRVVFAASGEEIEIVHRATSRQAFARGVAPAVRFLAGKTSGSFSMKDVLGL